MRIEEGKFYRTRDGRKVGPMMKFKSGPFPNSFIRELGDGFVWGEDGECSHNAGEDGECSHNAEGEKGPYHLVSEWTEGPVRTVTRQEIIPGTYDGVTIHDPGSKYVRVVVNEAMDHEALTRAAAVLTALAGALRDEQ